MEIIFSLSLKVENLLSSLMMMVLRHMDIFDFMADDLGAMAIREADTFDSVAFWHTLIICLHDENRFRLL